MNFPNAVYTMTFREFRTHTGTWLRDLFEAFSTEEDEIVALLEVFNGKWDVFEIIGETIQEQKIFMLDTFNEYYRYYKEILDNYKKQYDYSTGGRKITTFSRSGSSGSEAIAVELPNKKIDADNIYKYPDSGSKDSSTNSSSGTTTVYDTSAFLELKREYLDQIRNVYEEFAGRFSDCFMMIY